ncbi:hypothetical protein ILYODFUR_021789, partial [Ilyodon furcidens]
DGCGPSVLGPSSGTLSSLGYPRTSPNNAVCEWEITVPRGKRIQFRFALLDIQDSDCQVNYIRLYDGIGPERTEIVKYCSLGQNVDELVESSGNQVTVQFMSGMYRTGRGFYLSYSTTEHSDECGILRLLEVVPKNEPDSWRSLPDVLAGFFRFFHDVTQGRTVF